MLPRAAVHAAADAAMPLSPCHDTPAARCRGCLSLPPSSSRFADGVERSRCARDMPARRARLRFSPLFKRDTLCFARLRRRSVAPRWRQQPPGRRQPAAAGNRRFLPPRYASCCRYAPRVRHAITRDKRRSAAAPQTKMRALRRYAEAPPAEKRP